jgi:hypothetical protein
VISDTLHIAEESVVTAKEIGFKAHLEGRDTGNFFHPA